MTEGSEIGNILSFSLPLLAGNLFQQLYNIVDSVIVGRYLGHHALQAVGSTGSMTYFFYTLCIGLAAGAGILIAYHFGAGNDREVRKLIVNSLYVTAAFGIVLSLASAALTPSLLRLIGTHDSVFSDSVGYMRISCLGTISVAAYNWINSVMRSLGDSKTPLVFLIIASIINTVLDILFVAVLGFGVNGAALATVTAQTISAAGSIIFAFAKNPYFKLKGEWAYDRKAAVGCIKTGTPIALQNAMVSFSMIYLQKTANLFSDEVIAAYTATMRVEQLVHQPFTSLNMGISVFAGQNKGAGKNERVVTGYRKTMLTGFVFALFMLAVFMLFAPNVMGIFVTEQSVIDIGARMLRLSACFYAPLGVIHITRGLLNGAGDVTYAMINGIAEVAGRVIFASVLVLFPALGYSAVWLTTCFTWVLTAVMSLIRYKGGKWKLDEKVS